MPIQIGFIDYFIDEWHAQNYPRMIKDAVARGFPDAQVGLAWEQTTIPGKMNIDQFCAKHGIAKAAGVEQVVAESDAIIVLSPDNSEKHEELCQLPLRSGKPVYIDKPIAPDLATARRILDLARTHRTPTFSSSALRFGSELAALQSARAGQVPDYVATRGSGPPAIYAIHQYEMIVAAMGIGARRVQQVGTKDVPALVIEYAADRRAMATILDGAEFELCASYVVDGKRQTQRIPNMPDFFPRFIEAMLTFFATGKSPVKSEETLEIAALIEAGTKAVGRPGEWIDVPR